MEAGRITEVKRGNGRMVLLEENPCDHCGKEGTPYLAVCEQGMWAFCSYECREDALRVDGKPLTPELMAEADMHFIGPKPEA